jgi:hypothetical protein
LEPVQRGSKIANALVLVTATLRLASWKKRNLVVKFAAAARVA